MRRIGNAIRLAVGFVLLLVVGLVLVGALAQSAAEPGGRSGEGREVEAEREPGCRGYC